MNFMDQFLQERQEAIYATGSDNIDIIASLSLVAKEVAADLCVVVTGDKIAAAMFSAEPLAEG
jgi:hypothetical protein